ncbi:helix-turn-helix domain-containing protein [Paracoccus kondratievae]
MSDFDAGARLRELRTAAGMSQRQLAEASGVPHGQISMIETGRSSPRSPRCARSLAG